MVVAAAVRARWLATDDAQVIYATRVLGHTPGELAAAQGRDVRALRAQRARAERGLVPSAGPRGCEWPRAGPRSWPARPAEVLYSPRSTPASIPASTPRSRSSTTAAR